MSCQDMLTKTLEPAGRQSVIGYGNQNARSMNGLKQLPRNGAITDALVFLDMRRRLNHTYPHRLLHRLQPTKRRHAGLELSRFGFL